MRRLRLLVGMFATMAMMVSTAFFNVVYAQSAGIARGAAALEALTGDLEQYLDPVTNVVYVVASIIAVVSALGVYRNMQQGKDNAMSGAMGWFAAMLFVLVANTVVRAMFIG